LFRCQLADRTAQLFCHFVCFLAKLSVGDRLHGGCGVDRRHLHVATAILDDDVAGQHRADPVFEIQRLARERGIAGPEDRVGAELGADLLLKRSLDIDLADDSEPFIL
jgi:hypothetical protein